MITRRELLGFIFANGFASYLHAQGRPKLIGGLFPADQKTVDKVAAEFVQELRKLGYVQGKDFSIDFRAADGSDQRLRILAAELVQVNADVFIVATTNAATIMKVAAGSSPIVFFSVADPVASGFADSLARPGRNMTGLSVEGDSLDPKRLDLIRQMVPGLTRVAFLVNPESPLYPSVPEVLTRFARNAGLQSVVVNASKQEDLRQAFREMMTFRAQAMVVFGDVTLVRLRKSIAALAIQSQLPSISAFRADAVDGGLMSYGASYDGAIRRLAVYVDKILKGAKPANIPIEEPAVFEFVINRKTADLLQLKIPPALLLQTTEVIE